jgi:hypothetical protein
LRRSRGGEALIAAEQAWELSFGEAAFAVLAEDGRRLGG